MSLFNIPSSLVENQLVRLDQYNVIEIKGEDSREFLHNQFTNDLKNLPEYSSSLGAWCSPKGRVLYTFRIWRKDNIFTIVLPSVQTESFLQKLKMYILRADVTIDLATEKFVYGLSGKKADQALSQILQTPENDNTFLINDGTVVIKIPSEIPRFMIISSDDNFKLGSLSASSDHNHWRLLDIIAHIPEILPDTTDMFLPQMLDLERLGGLSFQKGCYPGQEIVARVKYRGEVKKQLYQAFTNAHTSIEIKPGTALVSSDGATDTLVGNIVNAVPIDNDGWVMLAVNNIKSVQEDEIKLQYAKEYSLQFQND